MCPKARFDQVGGFTLQTWGCEDWDLWTRLALTGMDLAFNKSTGMYYHRYPESRSQQTGAMIESRCDMLFRLHEHIITNTPLFAQ